MEFLEDDPGARAGAVLRSNLERVDVYCTGGLYDDPETGPTPRHPKQKIRRLWLRTRTGRLSSLFQREPPLRCQQCGRTVPIAGSYTVIDSEHGHPETGLRYEGGTWLRLVEWHAHNDPERRVLSVDISDSCYPW